MKKVGIMSMQRIRNYGSFMQAYALKCIIESLGCKVEFIDYHFEKSILSNSDGLLKKIKKNLNIIQFIKKRNAIKRFALKYDNDFLPDLCLSECNYSKDIDTLVIGSDEVFNCLQPYPVGYSRNLFGLGYEHVDVISYAACFGHTTYDELVKYNIDKEISNFLKKFKAISVRDNNSRENVLKLINNKAEMHLDPVLIYEFPKIKQVDINLNNYIIIYAYPGRLSVSEERYIKKFAKKHGKKILSLGSYQRIADYIKIVHPLELFAYFEKADFVITDTFHGSIFAIKTKTKFCTIIRNSNSNKLCDLLDKLSLTDRKIKVIDDIDKLFNKDIDYSVTYKILEEERKKSLSYLKKNL